MQQRNGRRGAVFSVRVTDEEREQLEAMQRQGGGPRSLGPWLKWRALKPNEIGADRPGEVVPTARARVLPDCSTRVILDLCSGSGSWSAPYAAAGYDVRRVSLPECDVRTYAPPADVWGVLAAPPCDQFSLARNGHASPRDYRRGLEIVSACLRIIATTQPLWWALENPTGHLSKWLGTPRDVFDPCDYGDPWTKRTALWGAFTIPVRGPYVVPLGGGPICTECTAPRETTWCNSAAHRAITPAGFARAFFEANP